MRANKGVVMEVSKFGAEVKDERERTMKMEDGK